MDIRLSLAIQHHPDRRHLPPRLLRWLGYPADHMNDEVVEVVVDPRRDLWSSSLGTLGTFPAADPSPWRCARLAWRLAPETCTHRVVLQDDAIPCHDFHEQLTSAIAERPDDALCLFFGQNSYQLDIGSYSSHVAAGERFYALPSIGWVPCVGLALPRDQALDLGSFYLPHHQRSSVADDEVVCEWAHARGRTVYALAPSIVDHDDSQPSLMGTDPTRIRSAVAFRGALC